MAKIISILLIIFWGLPGWAAQGIVVVLNAPLYQGPGSNEKIVQYVRQGQKIFIFDDDIDAALAVPPEAAANPTAAESNIDVYVDEEAGEDPFNIEKEDKVYAPGDFYRTIDKLGAVAYIPKPYVKIIFNDDRERGQAITLPYDETDYRLADVLPDDFPFHRKAQREMALNFRIGPLVLQHYDYPWQIQDRHYTSNWRQGFQTHWAKTLAREQGHRRYFGWRIAYWGQKMFLTFTNGHRSQESLSTLGGGPYFAYQAWRHDHFNLEFQMGGNLHFARSYLRQNQSGSVVFEERDFWGALFSTSVALQLTVMDLLPWVDIVLAVEGEYFFPAHLKGFRKEAHPAWWQNSPNRHRLAAHGQGALLLGLGHTY